jgi:ribonuclease E
VQRWPETKRLLGLLVNSSGGAHARNARRLVHAARKQDRRLQAALLAAAVAHTPEAEEVLRGARTRLARKPSALSRELLRNFPKGKGRRSRRRRKKTAGDAVAAGQTGNGARRTASTGPDEEVLTEALAASGADGSRSGDTPLDGDARGELDGKVADALDGDGAEPPGADASDKKSTTRPRRSRRRKSASARAAAAARESADGDSADTAAPDSAEADTAAPAEAATADEQAAKKPRRTRARKHPAGDDPATEHEPTTPPAEEAA